MLRPRITPCLLVRDGGLVKTVQFQNAKYLGDPINAVKIFNEKAADELVVLDIDATANGAEPDLKLIARLAVECRMPLCYGGGIKTARQAKQIIALGVEKVAVSSAIIYNPRLVAEISQEIGNQSVVVVFDVKKRALRGGYEVYTHNGRKATDKDPVQLAGEAAALGAGEVVINSIDHDGMMNGYDLGLATKIRAATSLPMTMLGGAGSLDDLKQLIESCGVIGAAAGSLFVFKGAYRAVLINYPSQTQKEDLVGSALRR